MKLGLLPPEPKIKLNSELFSLIGEADKAVYQLAGSLSIFPESSFIIKSLNFLEAVYSNSIDDHFDKQNSPFKFVMENESEEMKIVNAYVNALSLGQKFIKNIASPAQIIKSIHKELCSKKNSQEEIGGKFRNKNLPKKFSTSRFAETKYNPPSPEELLALMENLDKHISSDVSYPVLVNAALIHAQLEMIHPFEMYNGLVGRILFQLHLLWKKRLTVPAIQISKILYNRREEYFAALSELESSGSWDGWIKFFLVAVIEASSNTMLVLRNIYLLEQNDYQKLLETGLAVSSLKLLDLLFEKPFITLPFIVKELGLNKQTANTLLSKFLEINILHETTGQRRNRIFVYKKLIDILEC